MQLSCFKCGAKVVANESFCTNCGTRLEQVIPASVVPRNRSIAESLPFDLGLDTPNTALPAIPPPVIATPRPMSRHVMQFSDRLCSRCSELIPISEAFCSRCGTPTNPGQQTPLPQQEAAQPPKRGVPLGAIWGIGAVCLTVLGLFAIQHVIKARQDEAQLEASLRQQWAAPNAGLPMSPPVATQAVPTQVIPTQPMAPIAATEPQPTLQYDSTPVNNFNNRNAQEFADSIRRQNEQFEAQRQAEEERRRREYENSPVVYRCIYCGYKVQLPRSAGFPNDNNMPILRNIPCSPNHSGGHNWMESYGN